MTEDFSSWQSDAFESYFPVGDSDEYMESERTQKKAVIEAMQEVEAEFSSFESSEEEEECEQEQEEVVSEAEDTHDSCCSDTQPGIYQSEVTRGPSTQTSPHTDGSQDKIQSSLGAHTGEAARPGTDAPSASTKTAPPTEAAMLSAAAPPRQPPVVTSASRDGQNVQHTSRSTGIHDGGDGRSVQYKVHYHKPNLDPLEEEQFYLDNENVEFLRIDAPENQRTYAQLEILYRARGREIEELTRKLEEKDEERNKEIRNLKHRLAIANGEAEAVNESLREGQQLLQQSKSDHSEACGKIRVLESQVSSLRNTREELIQKLQTAESTIENLTHHIEELRQSESLSRARNEHEAVVASLTSRHERELLVVREKLDVCKTSLELKQEELSCVKKQLTDMARELELTQMSKAETVNRLTRSLEESQRQCQAILEQSSSPEVSMMRAQLQQTMASKRVSEDLCQNFQREIKELKEQLNMFESASQLGVFTSSSSAVSRPYHDDSISDLAVRKTLNFNSPQNVERQDGSPASDKLIASLKSELGKCLSSNRQQRTELADRVHQVKALQEELQEARSRVASLEKTCADQKLRLKELDSLNKPGGGGVGAVEARLQREVEDLKRERNALFADVEDYKTRLQEVGDSEAKLAEINAELSHQIAQMVNDFDQDKQSALQSYQRTMEAVNQHSFDKLHQEMQERFLSEKTMLMDDSKRKLDNLNQALRSTQAELDKVKSLYVKTCQEHSQREAEQQESYQTQLEEELAKMTDKLEKEKREWQNFMRAQREKEQEDLQKSLRQTFESQQSLRQTFESQQSLRQTFESQQGTQSNGEMMVSQDKLAQRDRHTELGEVLANAKNQREQEHERDLQQWTSDRTDCESQLASKITELCECHQKLDMAVSEKERLQKLTEDLELDQQTLVKCLEEKHKEEIQDILGKLDKQIQQVEEKLAEMIQQLSGSADNKRGSVANITESVHISGLLEKLDCLGRIMDEKEDRLRELEQMLQEQKATVSPGVSNSGSNLSDLSGSVVDMERYHGDLSETKAEKLREHVKKLESTLHTMKQKHIKEVNELKQQHQKEFENASRSREDKFQAELRYFLKEKEEQYKIKMETAMKQCESQAKLQLDQVLKEADEKHKSVMHETICEYEDKIAELKKIIEEYNDRFNKEIRPNESESTKEIFSLRDKMKREMCALKEKYNTEKSTLVRKLKLLEEQKDDEIVNLCLRQAEEERKLKQQFDNDLASLKVEHQNVIRRLQEELSSQKSDADKARELIELLKQENESNKLIVEELKTEVEQMKTKLSNKQGLTDQIKELRAKWFLEAQEYINKEISQGVEDKIKEGGTVREKLEKIKEEEVKIKDKWEKLLEVEEKMKRDQECIKEWEKNKEQFEREKKEELTRLMQGEIDKLNKKYVGELKARIEMVKTQMEQQKLVWQQEEKQKLEQQKLVWQQEEREKLGEDREKIIQALRSHMERSLQEAKKQLEMKMEKVKEKELWEMRNEMQGEMRKRIQSVREEWEREKADHANGDREEVNRLKESLQAETEARIKVCQERDEAIEQVKHRELLFREEEQRLRSGLKQCQQDMDEASRRHQAVTEQVNNIDRKYKLNLRKLKAGKQQELAELKAKHAEEKDSLVALLQAHYEGGLEKVRKQAEQERAALIVELDRLTGFSPLAAKIPQPGPRTAPSLKSHDQHLDPAALSPGDKLAYPSNVHPLMPAPVIGREVIDLFKVKAQTYIRSALSQKVPESSITALEQSLDVLSDHMKSMAAGAPGPEFGSRTYNSLGKLLDEDNDVITNKQRNSHTCSDAYINNMAVSDRHLPQHHHPQHSQNNHRELLEEQRWHSQPDQVDQCDFNWHPLSSSAANNSSPADQTYARSFVTSASKKPNITMSYLPHLSPNVAAQTRTIPTKLEANCVNDNFSGFSPRDERKFVEARVRLVNWAQTGEMPWKTSGGISDSQLQDADSFIKPGRDTEGRPQRDNSHVLTSSSRHANVTRQDPRYYNPAWAPSDSDLECSVSSDATTSFFTLKTDATD